MRTPFGQECKYYYADFHRGRDQQTCRLVEANPSSETWRPELCRDCPVPGILRANACEYLVLTGQVAKGFMGFGRKLVIETHCRKTDRAVAEPHIGCGECHAGDQLAALFGQD